MYSYIPGTSVTCSEAMQGSFKSPLCFTKLCKSINSIQNITERENCISKFHIHSTKSILLTKCTVYTLWNNMLKRINVI